MRSPKDLQEPAVKRANDDDIFQLLTSTQHSYPAEVAAQLKISCIKDKYKLNYLTKNIEMKNDCSFINIRLGKQVLSRSLYNI